MTTTTTNSILGFLRSGWLVFLVQGAFCSIFFSQTWAPEEPLVFSNLGDGAKNLYTLQTYLRDRPEVWFGYDAMNAPFGESLWYTDATPVIAIAFRGLRSLGVPADWLAIRGFHLFLLWSIALSTALLFVLLRHANVGWQLSCFASLLLPWVGPQILRLSAGHFNLSLGWIILGCWWLLMKWDSSTDAKRWIWASLLVIWIPFSAGFHLYYLPMLAFLVGVWLVVSAWQHRRQGHKVLERLVLAGIIPLLSGLLVKGWIAWTDPHTDLREAARGYNWSAWNLNLDSLVMAYEHLPLPAVPGLRTFLEIESHLYLGGFAIWTFVAALFWVVIRRLIPKEPVVPQEARPIWRTALQVSGWLCLLLAAGEYVRTLGGNLNVDNWLHPFKILRLLSKDITQFRCLGRFGWPVYWASGIGAVLLWDRLWKGSWGWAKAAFFLLFIPLGTDTMGQIYHLRDHIVPNPLVREASPPLSVQAMANDAVGILPLPYYHVGSEVLGLTIDPVTEWERHCLQTAIQLNLPLLSNKMSRTVPAQTRDMLEWIQGGKAPERLSGPVLVMKSLESYPWALPPDTGREPARSAFEASHSFAENNKLDLIGETEQIQWYVWRPE